MTLRIPLPLLALVLALPAPLLAQAAQDFSLPPNPAPSSTPRVQGPVDEESGPVPARPRAIRTATPTPAPASTPTPSVTIPIDERVFAPASRQPAPATRPQARPAARDAADTPAGPERTGITPAPLPAVQAPVANPAAVPAAAPIRPRVADESGPALPFDWRWLAGIGGALVVAIGGLLYWRRRRASAPPPAIERPVVGSAQVPAAEALTIRCEVEKLTRSAVFATLKYRFTLINRTDAPLGDVAIGLDLVSAHAGAPMEEQVATPGTPLDTRHRLARIAPHQTVAVEGQVQLPLAGAQVILQGRHPLLVPLLRLRVDGAGEGALVKTFVVGQGLPGGGRVQPFRLDEAPRSYASLAHRELA
ncbi:MAG: hypothetical protein WC692_06385 [Erythrobacter sp.]|jgi:hypothetical protein